MPIGNWVPPGPSCLGIWVRVIICTSVRVGGGGEGGGGGGGPSLMRFTYWHRRF